MVHAKIFMNEKEQQLGPYGHLILLCNRSISDLMPPIPATGSAQVTAGVSLGVQFRPSHL